MVFFCGAVACFCGFALAGEGAEVDFSVIELYSRLPFFLDFVPFKANVFRASFCFSFISVCGVLRAGSGSEVCLSIVQSIAVYVVAEHVRRYVNNAAMHPYFFSVIFSGEALPSAGVRAGGAFAEVPFLLCEARVVFGVNDGEFALCQGYSAEGVAIADSTVQQQEGHECVFDVEGEFVLFIVFRHVTAKFSPPIIGRTCANESKTTFGFLRPILLSRC